MTAPVTPHACEGGPAVVYLVLAHADPEHFSRLLRRLSHPSVAFVVHVDAKAKLAPFRAAAEGIPGVSFVERRLRVMWAAFSQVESTLRAMEEALTRTGPDCTHFIVLSGADYPTVPNGDILKLLRDNPRRQFIRRFDILNCGDRRQVWRLKGWHFRELADRNTWRRKPLFAIEQMLYRLKPKSLPRAITFASGSNWCALTRNCAAHCVSVARGDPTFTALFRHMFGPDEIFLHTIVQNSPFAGEAGPMEPYMDVTELGGPWRYGNLHFLNPILPICTAEEAEAILRDASGFVFARKFGSATSAEALATIDRALDARTAS